MTRESVRLPEVSGEKKRAEIVRKRYFMAPLQVAIANCRGTSKSRAEVKFP
jgi:hypothetical protein